ncbi:hypothetical protein [Pseudomonas viridiflava]
MKIKQIFAKTDVTDLPTASESSAKSILDNCTTSIVFAENAGSGKGKGFLPAGDESTSDGNDIPVIMAPPGHGAGVSIIIPHLLVNDSVSASGKRGYKKPSPWPSK